MRALEGLALLLLCQSVGELAARGLHLPFPGPVVGLLVLLVLLRAQWVQHRVSAVAEFLLSHLSLLFVPVGVGVMTHLALLQQYGARLVVVLVLSTWVALAVTAVVLRALLRDDAGGDAAAVADHAAHRAPRSHEHGDTRHVATPPENEEAR
ncbi:MAG: hypothetical protein Fur0019_00050 [Tibeticola sp.]